MQVLEKLNPDKVIAIAMSVAEDLPSATIIPVKFETLEYGYNFEGQIHHIKLQSNSKRARYRVLKVYEVNKKTSMQ